MTPAEQLGRLNGAISRMAAGQSTSVEVVLDVYWIFVRHANGFAEFKRRNDLGKWICRAPRQPEVLLQRAEVLLPHIGTGAIKLAKFTNLATPRANAGFAQVVAYCPVKEQGALEKILVGELRWEVYWKTNAQTYSEMTKR